MRDAGILDGDLLAVKKSPDARNGQIVVARLGDEVTVKRFSRNGKSIQLLPETPDFQPIVVSAEDEFSFEGIAVGLIRDTPLQQRKRPRRQEDRRVGKEWVRKGKYQWA